MASLEQIIRPFVVYDTTPARIPMTSSDAAGRKQDNVILAIGKNPSAKTLGTAASGSMSAYQEQLHLEIPDFSPQADFTPTANFSPTF